MNPEQKINKFLTKVVEFWEISINSDSMKFSIQVKIF